MTSFPEALSTLSNHYGICVKYSDSMTILNSKYNDTVSSSDVEKKILALHDNITQLNSHNICVSETKDGYLLSYSRLHSIGTQIKFASTKEQLCHFIKKDEDFNSSIACLYSNESDLLKMKDLMIERVENLDIHNQNTRIGIIATISNKTKELRAMYLGNNLNNHNKNTIQK